MQRSNKNKPEKYEYRILVVENDVKTILPIVERIIRSHLKIEGKSLAQGIVLDQKAYSEIDIIYTHTNLAQKAVDLAAEQLRTHGKPFDLIYMDNLLDDSLEGNEATKKIRVDEREYHEEQTRLNKDRSCFPNFQASHIVTCSSTFTGVYEGANERIDKPIRADQLKRLLGSQLDPIQFSALSDDGIRRKASAPDLLHNSAPQLLDRDRVRSLNETAKQSNSAPCSPSVRESIIPSRNKYSFMFYGQSQSALEQELHHEEKEQCKEELPAEEQELFKSSPPGMQHK